MPTTSRGYPYETPADEPGWSLTGGSTGASAILAQVVDGDVASIAARTTTAETNIATNTANLAAHTAATTGVHGIANTAALVVTTDTRLSDARTPTAHAASHASAGSDPITPAAIGAYAASGGTISGSATVAGAVTVNGINGLAPIRIVGRTAAPGAPASGTFAVGDLAIDSVGVWHLCTVAGTPGTWT